MPKNQPKYNGFACGVQLTKDENVERPNVARNCR